MKDEIDPFVESAASPGRRHWLRLSAAHLLGWMALPHATAAHPSGAGGPLRFQSVPVSGADRVVVPHGYEYRVIYPWGDPTGVPGQAAPAFDPDGGNSAAEQALQAGMHHDGMHFFPLGHDGRRALLVINHEYTDEQLLHTDGVAEWTAEKVRKSQAAMGVSVIELSRGNGPGWQQRVPSDYARRIHAGTPTRMAGPAAGHPLLRTAADPGGRHVIGTYANCAMGVTPWGTYLTCEENFHGYFGGPEVAAASATPAQRRYGTVAGQQWVEWWRFDERFDLSRHPNEANRFGWVVEIDPFDPTAAPVKRSALGRKRHESATCVRTRDGRVAVYMGDDARFEYIYKFVSRDAVRPGGAAANADILDEGTLYVARFDGDGNGQWLPLVHGHAGLDTTAGFADQAAVLVHARLAADIVGATPMDRPEWIAVHPHTGEVFASMTNNTQRGVPGHAPTDAANPRSLNSGGQVLRWTEALGDAAATRFEWSPFVLAGDMSLPAGGAGYAGPDAASFASPDGLHFDASGLLWIQTDMAGQDMQRGDYRNLGNNALLCADPRSGDIRRFLTGPTGCEITGCTVTPDRRTLFVNIQHPGEARDDGIGPPTSAWPDGTVIGSRRPRSATVAVWRTDGQTVGR